MADIRLAKGEDVDALREDVDTLSGKAHVHDNKAVLDGITATKVNAWNNPQTATTDRYGTVKLSAKGGISYAEGLTVNTNAEYGTGRTGDGKVVVKAATEEEIKAGTQEYKPIVPATFKKALEVNGCITDDNFNSKNPTKGYNSLDDLAIDTADAFEAVQALTTYDETPQEISTWINGTPIWRQAFKYQLTETDKEDVDNNQGIQLCNLVKVKNPNPTFVLNCCATLATYSDNPCMIDDIPLVINAALLEVFLKKEWFVVDDLLPHIYGYFEFVTPADNIKQ